MKKGVVVLGLWCEVCLRQKLAESREKASKILKAGEKKGRRGGQRGRATAFRHMESVCSAALYRDLHTACTTARLMTLRYYHPATALLCPPYLQYPGEATVPAGEIGRYMQHFQSWRRSPRKRPQVYHAGNPITLGYTQESVLKTTQSP